MREEYGTNPLSYHLILQRIFCNLTLLELKSVRLVCSFWGEEGAFNLRHRPLHIHLNPPHMTYESRITQPNITYRKGEEGERMDLSQFLTKYSLKHTLHLSLLDFHPWLNNTRYFAEHTEVTNSKRFRVIDKDFYEQHNNAHFTQNLLANYLPQSKHLVAELRLELMLKYQKDFQLLQNILEVVETDVEKLTMDIEIYADDLLKRVRVKNRQFSKIKALAIRLPRNLHSVLNGYWKGRDQLLPSPAVANLLSLFPKVSFLDLESWRPYDGMDEVIGKTSKFLEAALELNLNLDGLRARPLNEDQLLSILKYSTRKPLKFLYLDILFRDNSSTVQILEQILSNLSNVIERFDLIWKPISSCTQTRINLPPAGFSNLKSITFSSKVKVYDFETLHYQLFNPVDEKLCDVFGFKDLFAESGALFCNYFPFLESLSIILLGEGAEELYRHIFHLGNEKKSISRNIKNLTISLLGDCESEEINNILQHLFPNLLTFRHGKLRNEGDEIFVCHHKFDGRGKLIGKWEWLADVFCEGRDSKFGDPADYFYTAKYRFGLISGDHGFWDTYQDLERNDTMG